MLLKRLWPAALLALAGCAALKAGAGAPVDRPQADARQTVAALASDFEAGRAQPFFEHFDEEAFSNWEDFRYAARQFMLANRDITLDIVVDSVVTDDDETSVQTHWNRRYVNPSGSNKLDEGNCALIFRRRGPSLLLSAFHGDLPFD